MGQKYAKKLKALGPYSNHIGTATLDRRLRIVRDMEVFKQGLCQHVGGSPNAAQQALIDRVGWLWLRLQLLERKIGAGEPTQHDTNAYLAWDASFRRALRDLGLDPAAPREMSVAEALAQLHGTGTAP